MIPATPFPHKPAMPRSPEYRIPNPVSRGFTLIEILVVVVILGILAAIVVPRVMERPGEARVTRAKQDIQGVITALSLYKMDNYKYPTTDQGLKALVQQPNDSTVRNWKPGGYLGSGGLTKDPWQNEYLYVYPGQHGEYDIYSLGADAQEGGEGINADRGNWQTE